MACATQPEVHLPVLTTAQGLIETADGPDGLRAHDAEIRRFGRARFGLFRVVRGAAEAETAVVALRHRVLEAGTSGRRHDAAEVCRPDAFEFGDAPGGVAGRQLGVRVDPDDHRVARLGDGEVETDRDVALRIGDHADAIVLGGQSLDDGIRAIG